MEQLNSHVCHIDGKVGQADRDMIVDICHNYGGVSVSTTATTTNGLTFSIMTVDSAWVGIKHRLNSLFPGRIKFDVVTIESEQYGKT